MNRLAVVLMVKDEEQVIERCLRSIVRLKPELVIISDTGSKDYTMFKAAFLLQDNNIPFKIYRDPFVDFATNRTKLLYHASQERDIDYVLMIDADDVLVVEPCLDPELFKSQLKKDYYLVKFECGTTVYHLPKLLSNKIPWVYKGVTHEYLISTGTEGYIHSIHMLQLNDGFRRRNNLKLQHDADLIEEAFFHEKDEHLLSRYRFYLGMTYHGLKNYQKAIDNFKTRIYLGNKSWIEEVYYSHYSLGSIYATLNHDDMGPIMGHYLAAYDTCPQRIESIVALKNYCVSKGMRNLIPTWNDMIAKSKLPETGLFLEPNLYANH